MLISRKTWRLMRGRFGYALGCTSITHGTYGISILSKCSFEEFGWRNGKLPIATNFSSVGREHLSRISAVMTRMKCLDGILNVQILNVAKKA